MVIFSQAEAMNPSKRNTMEDVCVIHNPGEWESSRYSFVGVYDGHGGAFVLSLGTNASCLSYKLYTHFRIIGREMADFLKYALSFHVAEELNANNGCSVHSQIGRAFLAADAHAKFIGIHTSGSTVALCLMEEVMNKVNIITANVGDARICLYTKDFTYRMTTDHCPSVPSERNRIEETPGGIISRGRVGGILAISRSLGDQALKPYVIATPCIAQKTIQRDGNTFLIIACDGFWDVLSDTQAGALVREYVGTSDEKKTTVADFLVKEAIRLGTMDNVTIVVAWL